MTLTAGAAVRDISPTRPLFLLGYPHVPRISTGVNDPLYASALCMENESATLIAIAVDIVFVNHHQTRRCREAINESTGVPPEHILITATHTHSGPSTTSMLAFTNDPIVPPPDAEYVEQLCKAIVDAAVEAFNSRIPAELAVTTADATGVGGNRHSPDGPADPEVGLIYLRRKNDGSPLALQLVYSMHPTVMHEDSTLVSSDFPGYARALLQKQLPGVAVLYHTGPSGNQSPRYHVSAQTFAEAERLGNMLGDAALKAVQKLTASDFADDIELSAAQSHIDLPPRTFCSVAEAEQLLEQARAEYEQLKRDNAPHGPVRTAECTIFGAEERVTFAQAQEAGEIAELINAYSPTELQVLRVGPACLAGLPCECFVEYGLQIKEQACRRTFVISLANGELQGYIVTPDATGYEANLSLFLPEAGRLIVDASLQLIQRVGSPGIA